MKVARSGLGGTEYLKLQRKARAEGRPFDELLTLYALEGLLGRLATSDDARKFVLKGGVLLAAFGDRRPTRDADLLGQEISNDAREVEERITRVAATPRDDGLVFDASSIRSQVIREDDAYSGVRVYLTYLLASARIQIGVDVNVGDPVFPDPQEVVIQGLLPDSPPVLLRGYQKVSVVAEKVVTGMQRGVANTRWRDWADVWTLASRHSFEANELLQACRIVADHRQAALSPLADLVQDGYPELAQAKWSRWQRGQDHNPTLPADFSVVLAAVSDFIDPALDGRAQGLSWDHISQVWV